jgi:hypothetical protein
MAGRKRRHSVGGGNEATEARRAAACRAFWSDHTLNREFRIICGDRPFTLKEFVAFVIGLPADQFFNLAKQHPGGSFQ